MRGRKRGKEGFGCLKRERKSQRSMTSADSGLSWDASGGDGGGKRLIPGRSTSAKKKRETDRCQKEDCNLFLKRDIPFLDGEKEAGCGCGGGDLAPC